MMEQIKTYREEEEKLTKELCSIHALINTVSDQIREAGVKEWTLAGGCTHCMGRGWVVLWDTMDSMSGCYAEYGECPKCKGKKNPAPSKRSKYDDRMGVEDTFCKLPAWKDILCPLFEMRNHLEEKRQAVQALQVLDRGVRVLVARGRKVPKGTIGKIFWTGHGKQNYGYNRNPQLRVGLKTSDGTVYWTAASNVDVIVSE